MKINRGDDVVEKAVDMEGAENVTMKILIGPDEGSDNIIMRYFKVLPNGHTPRHTHIQEHIVSIQKGKGIVLDNAGNENDVSAGDSVYVPSNEEHQFKNPHDEPFEFICNIMNPERYE
ncbi:cupin domain-containing protein [candidate division KSB1 bacterium]